MISQNFSGHLVAHTDWPTHLKNKGVYFVKREKEPIPKTNFLSFLTCGDIHPNALDHFCAWVEEVSLIYFIFYDAISNILQYFAFYKMFHKNSQKCH